LERLLLYISMLYISMLYIRAYGLAVSGRDRGIPELRTEADTLIRPAN
jgi:hypothetical protein